MEGSYSSQSSEYSSSYSTVSSPPHTPPELALASPMLILPRTAPVARHLESPLRPQRLHIPPFPVDLAKPTTEHAMFIHHSPSEYTAPAAGRPLWTCVPLVHPIPRSASQPRSPLLDYPSADGEDAENVNEPYEIEPPSCPPIMPMPMPIEPAPVLELDMRQQHQQEYFYTSAREYSSTGMYTTASPVSPQQQQLLSPLELPGYIPHTFAQHAPYRVVTSEFRVSHYPHYPHSQYYSESDVSPEDYACHASTHSY
ncbi:hypothetical protein DFH08DRAFT_906079 [Mycena albidolilacea]|uniref:Uncharacterized protein n=1 Tax=Mycena albidolilacea TaxID=1033008 RepID=A0AAD6YYY4_9AGAR|nr:hypothetical protein DFH08DRAFT_906079 [Mycena albidolilacea]